MAVGAVVLVGYVYRHELAAVVVGAGCLRVGYGVLRHRFLPRQPRRGRTLLEVVAAGVGAWWLGRNSGLMAAQPPRMRKRAGFMLACDRKPKRGEPGSSRLGRGDEIPY